jgi:prolyl-tRNA editing enzyme YbaK/EbsC (Cys-tRNA(Pro) deacylase)
MAIEVVKEYFEKIGIEDRIMEFKESCATVELAANAVGTIPAKIAKTLAFKKGEGCFLVVAAGDAKVDNKKFKAVFEVKAKMLGADEVIRMIGHAIGGVCPFGIDEEIPVFLDISLQRFETVFPACGSSNSAIELTCKELFEYSNAMGWVDVCKDWE